MCTCAGMHVQHRCAHVHTHKYTHMHTDARTCMRTHMCMHMCTQMRTDAHAHTLYMHTCMYTHMGMRAHIFAPAARTSVRVYAHTHTYGSAEKVGVE